MECKDPSLDTQSPLTTLDVALMNTDLVESLVTVMEESGNNTGTVDSTNSDSLRSLALRQKVDITASSTHTTEKSSIRSPSHKDIYIEASELTPAEQLAQEVKID